jgi:hypothetical protein
MVSGNMWMYPGTVTDRWWYLAFFNLPEQLPFLLHSLTRKNSGQGFFTCCHTVQSSKWMMQFLRTATIIDMVHSMAVIA